VTFADNSTENIALAGPLPAGDFLQTQIDGAGGSQVVVTNVPLPPPPTYTWIDGTSGDWGTAADWSGGIVPTGKSNAIIGGTGTETVTVTNQAVNVLTLNDANATFDVFGPFSAFGGLNVIAAHAIEVALDATFVIGGGSQTIDNTTIDLGTSSSGATLSTDLAATQGAVLTLGPNLTVDFISGSIKTAQSAGNAIVNDGTIETDGALHVGTIVGYDVTNKGTISVGSGAGIAVHVASSFDNSGTISGQGGFGVTGAAAFTNTGTIGVGSAQIAAGSFDNESTITVATGATATITVNSGSNNGMISVGGRLSLGGTLGGSGAIIINDAGTLELTAGTLSEAVSFASGGVGTLQLDGRHLFTGTLSGLAIGDTIDFAKADVTTASIAGNTLTVTFADNSTENIALAGPLPAGDFLQTQIDGAGGSELVVAPGATTAPTVQVSIDRSDVNLAHNTALVTFTFSEAITDFSIRP
jgi:hypothetical protein